MLTDFGVATLQDRYLLPDETPNQLFRRVAKTYSNGQEHEERLYQYMVKLWFMPSTPILSNAGTNRGLPISCYLNSVDDSLGDIIDTWKETAWLAAKGGGIGTSWANIRSINEKVGLNGKTSGVVPFIKIMDSLTLGISQGSLRRGSSASYLPINHPEIEEFIELRKPTGGDPNRKALNIHHGVTITDDFMEAVEQDKDFDLISPKSGKVVRTIKARDLWIRILTCRVETGEPYLVFIDTVNKHIPEHHKEANLKVVQSNLCSEITLPTNDERTAVCCLASVNLEYYYEWQNDDLFIKDILYFLDNVLSDFIDRTANLEGFKKAHFSAKNERSIGLGVMGFHSFLQKHDIPFESVSAKSLNNNIFKTLNVKAKYADKEIMLYRGPCPDSKFSKNPVRFSNIFAIAPTASISVIAGNASAGIEPFIANAYTQKTLSGSFNVRNKYLKKVLQKYNKDTADVWSSITTNEGSVQHLDFLNQYEKDVFKTAFEIDQRWIIEHASDRQKYICQSQSVNLFLPANVHKRDLHKLHFSAWQKGLKSLYYCRSRSVGRADVVSHVAGEMPKSRPDKPVRIDYDECLACQ